MERPSINMVLSIRAATKPSASLAARHVRKEMTSPISRRAISSTGRWLDMHQPLTISERDPMKIFDEIDVNSDGVISREEFKQALERQALERIQYSNLLKVHKAAAANLEALNAKMGKIEEIEKNLDDLKETNRKKKHAYENVGWMTANDIDALFDDDATQKQNISDNVSDLKKLLVLDD
ncbi:hypothetical protein ACHAWF_016522, partial [Thalassiosira exigua]